MAAYMSINQNINIEFRYFETWLGYGWDTTGVQPGHMGGAK